MQPRSGFYGLGVGRVIGVLVAVAVAGCVAASPAAATEVKTIPVGKTPYAVSSDGTHVWVANYGSDTVSEIKASSGTVEGTIPVGEGPDSVSSDGTHVWVANYGPNTVTEIKAISGAIERTIALGATPLAVSSDGTHVWVANFYSGTVAEINASSGGVERTIAAFSEPLAVSSDGTHVWVANYGSDTVTEINASSGTVERSIAVGEGPDSVSSDGTHVWVANEGADTVSEINASSGTVERTITGFSEPFAVSSDGTHVWVANYGSDTVSEINASSGTVEGTIPVGEGPDGVSSDGTHVWVANEGADTVSEILISKPSFTIEKEQKIEGEAGYRKSKLTAYVGETVDYKLVVKNTGNVSLTFGLLTDGNCEGISPRAKVLIAAGGEETYTCSHKLTSTGAYSNEATIEGSEGTGAKTSNKVEVEVVKALCATNTGTIKLSPGLTNTAAVQTMKIKGTLSGCTGEPFTSVAYKATLKTTGMVGCPVLKGTGELASGAASFKWTPKTKPSKTTGTLGMLLTETPSAALSGELTAGPFSPLTLSGKTSITFTGGSTCGGKKAVTKGTFTSTTVAFT